jgi:hypothetical protein
MLFAKLPEYNPYRDLMELREKENAMWKAYKDGKLEEALKLGNGILEKNSLRSMTHFIFARVYERLNNSEKQKFHDEVFFQLVRSVIESGDGKTPETAMTVISIEEEYTVLDVLGFEQEFQELVNKNGKWFDHLQARNHKTGESRDFWFDINLFYGLAGKESSASIEAGGPPTPSPQMTAATTVPSVVPTTQSTTPSSPQSLIVNPPPGWIPIPQIIEDPTEIGYYWLTNNQGDVLAEYVAMREELPSPMDLREYLEFVKQNRLKLSSAPGYTPQETIETTLAGLSALRHDFLFTSDGQQMHGRALFVILGNQVYSFFFYSTAVGFPSLEAPFTQALASISIQGESKVEPDLPATPLQPAEKIYQDPGGVFEVTFPEGATKKRDIQNGVVFVAPTMER